MHQEATQRTGRTCKRCGAIFTPRKAWQAFHSVACRRAWHAEHGDSGLKRRVDELERRLAAIEAAIAPKGV